MSDSYRFTDHEVSLEHGSVSGAREIPAWALSLGVHIVVLMMLGSITYVTGAIDDDTDLTSLLEEYDERDYKFENAIVQDIVGNASDANTLSASQAAAQVINKNPQEVMQRELEEEILTVESPPINDIVQPPEADLARIVETSGTSDKVGGVEGSIDRMTYEIQNSLKERQTLVCWLFDESGSLADRRAEIADRFENIYGQLDAMNTDEHAPLKTGVIGFGKGLNFYTPEPITDVRKAVNLVRGIKNDESGVEMVFSSVEAIVQKWGRKFRSSRDKHNCMIVIVTDERGDDYEHLEDVSHHCQQLGFKVYCIGNASPFGREKGFVRYVYPDEFEEDIPVDQGPESVNMEVVDLPFWGGRGVNTSRVSSGLGPYALTRLCAETGGMYLIAQDARGKQFDTVVMKDYLPDYRPVKFYLDDVSKNGAKRSLLQAADSVRISGVRAPTLRFRADSDNALRSEAAEAQKAATVVDHRVSEIVAVLESGEKDRPKLRAPRWKAAYDLAIGRALAIQARAKGYNWMLAKAKTAPPQFETEGNNTWTMVPSNEVQTGPEVRKIVAKANEYLARVVDDHPGTPWAYLAELELANPLGWSWQESKTDYAAMGRGGGDDANRVMFLEEEDPKTGQKRKVPRKRPNL